jgi:hypothetical protein
MKYSTGAVVRLNITFLIYREAKPVGRIRQTLIKETRRCAEPRTAARLIYLPLVVLITPPTSRPQGLSPVESTGLRRQRAV